MNLLLDTTFLIGILRKNQRTIAGLERIAAASHEVHASTINLAEVYTGVRNSELKYTSAFLSQIHAFDVTPEIAQRGGLLRNSLLRKGKMRDLDDMLVAATALEYGLHLVTENRKDFEGTGVTFYEESGI
jgi:predicted nucleic acid-binding protein